MQIVTVSGFKGGTGKTTLASLLGVAATLDGRRTAGLDLDPNTRNFGSVLTRRRAAGLAAPDHVAMVEFDPAPARDTRWLETMIRMAREEGYELLIIDTGSGKHDDLYQAHLLADVILTPLNESPADMHGLFALPNTPQAAKVNYRELVDMTRFGRKALGLPVQRWHVCRNRISPLPTRLGTIIERRVETLAEDAGFEAVWTLRDRVAHRSIGLDGRTVLDPPRDGPLTMSELAGRSEARALLGVLDTSSLTQAIRLAA